MDTKADIDAVADDGESNLLDDACAGWRRERVG
jgi:hypothetical protein